MSFTSLDLNVSDAPAVGGDLEDGEEVIVRRSFGQVACPGPVGVDHGEPAPMARFAADGSRREPRPVAGAVEDEVGLGDRQLGPARAVGVDAPGLELLILLADRRTDDDLPAVASSRRVAPSARRSAGEAPRPSGRRPRCRPHSPEAPHPDLSRRSSGHRGRRGRELTRAPCRSAAISPSRGRWQPPPRTLLPRGLANQRPGR